MILIQSKIVASEPAVASKSFVHSKRNTMQDLIILAHVPTDSVNLGFLPAAKALGLNVVLLSDHADAHRRHFNQAGLPAYPDTIVACDVFNPLAVIDALSARATAPAAVFSNSDHLQTSTAIAADYYGLPHKDWPKAHLVIGKYNRWT